MAQYTVPFTANPEVVQVPDKQVQEDHLNGLPVRVMDGSGLIASSATNTTAIPSANSLIVVKASKGRLAKVVITATGTGGPVNIYDNASAASGTILFAVPANAAAGTIYALDVPAANGITVGIGPASSPAFTVYWS